MIFPMRMITMLIGVRCFVAKCQTDTKWTIRLAAVEMNKDCRGTKDVGIDLRKHSRHERMVK